MSIWTSEIREFIKLSKIKKETPSIAGLTMIIQAFLRFPFENATKILSQKNTNDSQQWKRRPDRVLSEHIDMGAGGTCFSLTYFLKCILEEIGYDAYPVICDRSYGPATHSALIVIINKKKYLVDPGYLIGVPFLLPDNGATKGNKVELLRLGESSQYALITPGKNGMKIRYKFKNIELPNDDFEKAWQDSFSWPMMGSLTLGKSTINGFKFSRDLKMISSEKENDKNAIKKISEEFGVSKELLEEAIICLR